MAVNQLGEFALVIGDIHIPQRASQVTEQFRDLLLPNKMQYVLSPGNLGSKEVQEWLESLAAAKSQMHAVAGEFDDFANFPETKVVTIGNVKIGIIHGHQVTPWGDIEALAAVQRKLDCDVLIHGHTHQYGVQQYDGKYFINPGSATGAFSALNSNVVPSFILMAIQGDDIVIFNYMLEDNQLKIDRVDLKKQ